MECVDIRGGEARSIDCFIPFVWRSGDLLQPHQEDVFVIAVVTVPDGGRVTRLNLSGGSQPGF